MPGRIIAAQVIDGAAVVKGQPLVTLEAMKMEHTLTAPFDGVATGLAHKVGDQVSESSVLLRIRPNASLRGPSTTAIACPPRLNWRSNRSTVREALRELQTAGLLTRTRGSKLMMVTRPRTDQIAFGASLDSSRRTPRRVPALGIEPHQARRAPEA